MRSLIKRETPAPADLDALQYLFGPATYEESVLWLSRLIAHYPRRDMTKDTIIVTDCAADMVEFKISLVAVCAVADDLRRSATEDSPYFPVTGEVLKLAKAKMETYELLWKKFGNKPVMIEAK